MRLDIVTIFPEYFAPLDISLLGKARRAGLLDVRVHDLREWTHDRHRTVDDTPYGGGPGMVMKPDPWGEVLDTLVPPFPGTLPGTSPSPPGGGPSTPPVPGETSSLASSGDASGATRSGGASDAGSPGRGEPSDRLAADRLSASEPAPPGAFGTPSGASRPVPPGAKGPGASRLGTSGVSGTASSAKSETGSLGAAGVGEPAAPGPESARDPEAAAPGGEASATGAAPGTVPRLVIPTPSGRPFTQADAVRYAAEPWLIFACGRYEGIDSRVAEEARTRMPVDEVSLGDFVLAGGEVAVLVMVEAIGRLLPGVLGNADSVADDSFAPGAMESLLEGPVYTKPPVWRERPVPDILLSGHHGAIARWRRDEALRRTARHRPELLSRLAPEALDKHDRAVLREAGFPVDGEGMAD
ncbi:tRNA (guanine-N1)-methyltransferase [Actinomadura mexicana]|uniref:tRNA (guanine-N(1)-)-methyltransferase n=1 Tax=Actinomadura mexicana TaxID=134959 RepID=A0A238YYD4_9ACTN|nr:tRNA (guanine-N1)-methyltransferase [Actinomadura mexicana]